MIDKATSDKRIPLTILRKLYINAVFSKTINKNPTLKEYKL